MVHNTKRAGLSFWQAWRRGVVRLGNLYVALLVFGLVWSLAKPGFKLVDSLPTPLTVGIDVLFSLGLLLLIPPLITALLPGPEQGVAEQSDRLHPLVDELARRVGLDFEQDWISQVEALVRAGKSDEAAKEYRAKLGVTWDEAHQAINVWPDNDLERKLQAIIRHLHESEGAPPPATEK